MTISAREGADFDVVIAGTGPAGLAAIRLKQVSPDASVIVVKRGFEVGAHILSGVVVDPIGLDRLRPEWRTEDDRPLTVEVNADIFYYLGPSGRVRLPNFVTPPGSAFRENSLAGWEKCQAPKHFVDAIEMT